MSSARHGIPPEMLREVGLEPEANGAAWKAADREESNLRTLYQELFDVITGRMPRQVEWRWWNRALETPVLIDVYDWTDEQLIFSVLVWPSLESPADEATYDHRERVRVVLGAISKGAAEMSWSNRFETDYGLRWGGHKHQVWTTQDGFAYDGKKTDDAA
jgi:hypothetical protein